MLGHFRTKHSRVRIKKDSAKCRGRTRSYRCVPTRGLTPCLCPFLLFFCSSGGAKARNAVLDTLKKLASKYKTRPFSYVWVEGGSQPVFEDQLLQGNTFYPAVVAVNYKKSRFSPMAGSFTVDAIGNFLKNLLSGKEATIPFAADKIQLIAQKAWDGKDGVPPVEEKEL